MRGHPAPPNTALDLTRNKGGAGAGSKAVTASIHATQERLLKRQMGGILESKLRSRPHMRQLVLHNIIPEEDEYEDHELRLWGHLTDSDARVKLGTVSHTPGTRIGLPRPPENETADEVIRRMQQLLLDRLADIRQGMDALRLARTRSAFRQ